jgi:flagellar FliL protein
MAESDDAKGAAAGADAVAADGAKKKGGGLLFILLPVALVAAGGGGFLAYAKYPTIARMMYTFDEAGSEEEVSAEEGEEGETAPYGTFLELKDIIVNPADSNGRRLLMVSLGLETTDPLLLESITAREMVVRDTIIKLLGQRTIEELAAIEQRNAIKDALRMAVNGVTPEGEIRRLYFTQYVLQ